MKQTARPKKRPKAESTRSRRRPNAFERARDSAMRFNISIWAILAKHLKKQLPEARLSARQIHLLGYGEATIGAVALERRTIRTPGPKGRRVDRWTLTRPLEPGWTTLPLEMIEDLAGQLVQQAEAEHRAANIEAMIQAAREFSIEDSLSLAREVLGQDATEHDLQAFAAQTRLPDEVLAGGETAARFFDEQVSVVGIEDDEHGQPRIADDPPPTPGSSPMGDSEWDYYSPEEIEDRGGPESDWSYAFRVQRLCAAIRGTPDRAVTLGIQLGAVLREWAIWREFDEFVVAGVQVFERQSQRATGKPERAWMKHVREDVLAGRVSGSVAAYARKVKGMRQLSPPSAERIKNFIYEVRKDRAAAADPDPRS